MATTEQPMDAANNRVSQPHAQLSRRLLCLDVYRGLMVAAMIVVDNPGSDEGAYWPIVHAKWNGWTPADFIFPSFLFLVGISLVYSFEARLERGQTRKQILWHAFKRTLILIGIGLLVNASPIVGLDLHTWRFEGVTQRIGICYFFAAILELWAGRRGQLLALLGCLVGYWVLLRFVPVPGAGLPQRDLPFMDPVENLPAWLDRKLFMGHLYDGTRDPEGILHTIPAIGTTIIGVLTGHWLKSKTTVDKRIGAMVLLGILGMLGGRNLGPLVSHQQESLDQFVRIIQRRLRAAVFVLLVLGDGGEALAGAVDHADPGVRHECHRRICGRFPGVWAGILLHRQGTEWSDHELA